MIETEAERLWNIMTEAEIEDLYYKNRKKLSEDKFVMKMLNDALIPILLIPDLRTPKILEIYIIKNYYNP